MFPRSCVFLFDLCELLRRESVCQPDQCRPKPAVHDSHFALDGLTRYGFDQARHGSSCAHQHDSVRFDESQRGIRTHHGGGSRDETPIFTEYSCDRR